MRLQVKYCSIVNVEQIPNNDVFMGGVIERLHCK